MCLASQPSLHPDCAPPPKKKAAPHRTSADLIDMKCIYVARKPLDQPSMRTVSTDKVTSVHLALVYVCCTLIPKLQPAMTVSALMSFHLLQARVC